MSAKYGVELKITTPGRIGRHKELDESRIVRRVSTWTGHVIGEHRIIDRRQNRYYKRMVDTETGEVVHFVDEPLSEHQGHGTAAEPARDDESG